MKKPTFIRLSLLAPYVLWVIFTGLIFAMSVVFPSSESFPIVSGVIAISFVYSFGILVWGIPYTLLALGLWIWSRGKSADTMTRVFALSPVFLAILIAAFGLVLIWRDSNSLSDIGEGMLALGGIAIAFGYGTIGVVFIAYRVLRAGKFIVPEGEIPPAPAP
jgi:hypothetical protein